HFVYNEQIAAAYGSAEWKGKRWTLQGGLRFEATTYDARQLGNTQVKDSAFSRSYTSLFPTLLVSLEADSNHSWTLSAGRRIDRPPFQKLNPFSFFINKYTVQRGNPYFRPQYSWNMELAHNYKGWLLTSLGYSITTDYFAQLFPVDAGGIVVYTEGNLGRLQVLSLTVGVQRAPLRWWSLSANVLLQHKWQEGFIERAYSAEITQGTLNLTNSFRFGKGWAAELSGQYVSRSQNDIQELVDPAGQLSAGISKTILKGAGTLRLAGRDLLYTQWMKGNTEFKGVSEWFKLTRDTRVVVLNFNWRFGKAFRQAKRSGSASEELQRVGNG
ncbi:MAG: TonB-dependent receptor, partial [Sphingobacteriales bacterium]